MRKNEKNEIEIFFDMVVITRRGKIKSFALWKKKEKVMILKNGDSL